MGRERRDFGHIRDLPSGRYQASFIGHDNVRHNAPVTFSVKGQAEAWLNAERKKLEDEDPDMWVAPERRYAPKNTVTVGRYSTMFVDLADIRPTTRTLYERLVRIRIEPALGDLPMSKITRQDIAQWWAGTEKKRSDHQAYSLLRTICGHAVDEQLLTENPCTIKGAGKASREKTVDPPTPTQVQAIADSMQPRWRVGVLLGAWCGLRSGELRELRRKDVDLNTGSLRICRAVSRAGNRLVIGEPKTDAGNRAIPIPSALLPILKDHMEQYVGDSPDSLVISTEDGLTVHDGRWARAFHSACIKAFVPAEARERTKGKRGRPALPDFNPGITFHDLRHVSLTYAAIAGATLRELQALAGHTTPAMAMRYQEVARGHLAEVMDRVSDMMTPSSR